ncbi:hypothetical protein, partial [Siminovitchia fortis]|uniref:hypothetical protein n=1 Tax=Siminovitchia fortis TaxID=254758 RepID=UPI001C92D52E
KTHSPVNGSAIQSPRLMKNALTGQRLRNPMPAFGEKRIARSMAPRANAHVWRKTHSPVNGSAIQSPRLMKNALVGQWH